MSSQRNFYQNIFTGTVFGSGDGHGKTIITDSVNHPRRLFIFAPFVLGTF